MFKKILFITSILCLLFTFNNVNAENISNVTRYNSGNTYYLLINYDDGSSITMSFITPWDRDEMYEDLQYKLEHPNEDTQEYGSSLGLTKEEADKYNLNNGYVSEGTKAWVNRSIYMNIKH